MKFIKSYKKLYQIEKEKNCELKKENAILREKVEKEKSPFSIKVYFDDESYVTIDNVVEYKTNYTPVFPPIAQNWIIKTADGLTSVIDYNKVMCIRACRKNVKEEEKLPTEYFRGKSMSDEDFEQFIKELKNIKRELLKAKEKADLYEIN